MQSVSSRVHFIFLQIGSFFAHEHFEPNNFEQSRSRAKIFRALFEPSKYRAKNFRANFESSNIEHLNFRAERVNARACNGSLTSLEWTAYFHKVLFLCYQTLTKVSNKMFPTIFHCRGWFVIPCHGRCRLCYSDKTSPIYKVVPWWPERLRLLKSWCKHLLVKLETWSVCFHEKLSSFVMMSERNSIEHSTI